MANLTPEQLSLLINYQDELVVGRDGAIFMPLIHLERLLEAKNAEKADAVEKERDLMSCNFQNWWNTSYANAHGLMRPEDCDRILLNFTKNDTTRD